MALKEELSHCVFITVHLVTEKSVQLLLFPRDSHEHGYFLYFQWLACLTTSHDIAYSIAGTYTIVNVD
jgi:hypothetical protein